MQTFHQNSKLSLQLNKPAINTKTKTRQINLVPTLLITALLLVVGTLGYISYYLYSQNQSLQKPAYAQSNNLKQDAVYQN
jgi:cytochrome c-type biogenesis protein CcmH/NrfG